MAPRDIRQAAVVTISDGVASGRREDGSGAALRTLLDESGFQVLRSEVVPDERTEIERILKALSGAGVLLIVTTGGTGLGPRDLTPEATLAVIDRELPGLSERMRAAGREKTPFADLSRGIAGSRGSSLILNLPGSPNGAVESLSAVLPVLPHALEVLAGRTSHDPTAHAEPGAPAPATASPAIEDTIADRRAAGEELVLAAAVKVHGDPPCKVGQKILLGRGAALAGTLGCAEFDDAAIGDSVPVLDGRTPATRTYRHDRGSVEVYLEPLLPAPLLVVFCATPVALALMRWGRDLGFDPILVERRHERLTAEYRSSGRVAADLQGLALGPDTAAIHTDHDAPGLAEEAAALLRSPARFIGVMGSARHLGSHMARLREMGFEEEDLSRIRTPVGLDIGAQTAEEIALSILSGVVADAAGAGGGWLDSPMT